MRDERRRELKAPVSENIRPQTPVDSYMDRRDFRAEKQNLMSQDGSKLVIYDRRGGREWVQLDSTPEEWGKSKRAIQAKAHSIAPAKSRQTERADKPRQPGKKHGKNSLGSVKKATKKQHPAFSLSSIASAPGILLLWFMNVIGLVKPSGEKKRSIIIARVILLILSTSVSFLVVSSLLSPETPYFEEVAEFTEKSSTGEFWLLMSEAEVLKGKKGQYIVEKNMEGTYYHFREKGITLVVANKRVIMLSIYGGDWNFYGIGLGESIVIAEVAMPEHGFRRNNLDNFIYQKNIENSKYAMQIGVTVDEENNISQLTVYLLHSD